MSLYKRKDSPYWWVRIQIPGCKAVQESTRTRDRVAARKYHDALTVKLWEHLKAGERPEYLWEDAVLRWLEETSHKRDHEGDKQRLRWLHPHLEGRPLESITRAMVDRIMANRPELKSGSINRYLATLRSILRRAERDWGWIDKAPAIPLRPEPKPRIRWLTPEEATRLLQALPPHLADAAEFAFATGLRQANVFGLEWKQLDLGRRVAWIHADQAKGKKDLAVPLNTSALDVLRRNQGKHPTHVFTYQGRPIRRPDILTWQRACAKAGIENFRWHDIRHVWASWHVMNGTDLHTLMELGGWSSYEMVRRYAHLSGDHLQRAAENVTLPLRDCRTTARDRDSDVARWQKKLTVVK